MNRSVLRPALAGLAAAALTGGVLWLWQRWAFSTRSVTRERDYLPAPPVPDAPDVQHEEDGDGPRFHRRYRVDIAQTTKSPEDLVACIGRDIQAFVPEEIAVFQKTIGAAGSLADGDRFDIKIRSPWNGPVRVVETSPTSFALATLDGHLEAGLIRFSAADHPTAPGALRFTIESWARSADAFVDFVYDDLGIAKKAQEGMWTFFCNRVAETCGGEQMGEIEVLTERAEDPRDAA